MGIKKNTQIAAEQYAVKASRIAADAVMQQAARAMREDEQVRPVKAKRGKQALSGRTRVERSKRWDEVETIAVYGSWGYVGPRGTVTNVRDEFTLGVVDGSGAMGEAKDLPVYQFRYVDGGRNFQTQRDFGLALARRWARRYAGQIAQKQGAMVWVNAEVDCLVLVWEDDQEAIYFGHVRSKDQLRELICK